MASLQLAEYVIAAAAAKLTAGVNARIDTINAEYADDVTVNYPAVYEYGVSPMPPGTLLVVTDGGTPEGGSFGEEGAHSLVYDLQLLVLCKDDDADRDRLGRRLLRLERAVIETLWDDDPKEGLTIIAATGPNQPIVKVTRVVPGPVFQPDYDTSLLTAYRIAVFQITKREL